MPSAPLSPVDALPLEMWPVPLVDLQDGQLVWRRETGRWGGSRRPSDWDGAPRNGPYDDGLTYSVGKAATPHLLESFIYLGGGHVKDDTIFTFAQKFGPLTVDVDPPLPQKWLIHNGSHCYNLEPEPVHLWKSFARDLGILLRVAKECHRGAEPPCSVFGGLTTLSISLVDKPGSPTRIASPEDRHPVENERPWFYRVTIPVAAGPFRRGSIPPATTDDCPYVLSTREGAAASIVMIADWMLARVVTRVSVRSHGGVTRSSFRPDGLLAALAIQFASALSPLPGSIICEACGNMFRGNGRQRKYCSSECGSKYRQKSYRQRKQD